MPEARMTPKQQRFVEEYLVDLNGTAAARRAGYSTRAANEQAARLLAKTSVQEAVRVAREELSKRTAMTQDWVLGELRKIAAADPRRLYRPDGTLKTLPELDDDTAAAVSAVDFSVEARSGQLQIRKLRRWDKIRALELIGRHLGMFEHTHQRQGQEDPDTWMSDHNRDLMRTINELRKPRTLPLLQGPRGNGADE